MAGRGRSGGVVLASILFHAVLLALLVRYSAQTLPYEATPTIQVSLVQPSRPARAARDVPKHRRPAQHAVTPSTLASPIRPTVSPPTIGEVTTATAPPESDLAARARQALRGARSCDRERLTPEERERCETERGARIGPVTARLNLDPTGRFAKDPEPFLSKRPTKGCRARLTGDTDPMGNDMNSRAGVTCVKRF